MDTVSTKLTATAAERAEEADVYGRRGQYRQERRIDGLDREQVCQRFQKRILLLSRRLSERLPSGCDIGMDDLASFGAIGLLEAFDRFDPSRNILFSTFAEYRIRGAMMDALRQNDSFTRYRRDLSHRIHDATHTLTLLHGRPPEPEEVAARLDMDLDAYWQARDSITPVSHTSIDATVDPSGDESGRTLAETLQGDDGTGPYRAILGMQARDQLKQAIKELPDRKRDCVLLYYGRGMNLAEIAEVFEVTPSRISQILSAARKELKQKLAGDVTWGDIEGSAATRVAI